MRATIAGLKALNAKLKSLEQTAATRVGRRAVSKGVSVVNKGAKRRAPEKSKLLKKSIGQKVKVYRGSKVVVGVVGPRVGFATTVGGKKVDPVKYGHIAEKGHGVIKPKKKRVLSDGSQFYGKLVKAVKGSRFLQRTLDEDKPAIAAAMATGAKEAIEKL